MAFGGLIGWLFNWKCRLSSRISSNIANYLKCNYLSDGDGINNVMLRFWTFADFCSRYIVGVAGDDIMFHILVIKCAHLDPKQYCFRYCDEVKWWWNISCESQFRHQLSPHLNIRMPLGLCMFVYMFSSVRPLQFKFSTRFWVNQKPDWVPTWCGWIHFGTSRDWLSLVMLHYISLMVLIFPIISTNCRENVHQIVLKLGECNYQDASPHD